MNTESIELNASYFEHEWSNQTTVNPLGFLLLCVAAGLLLVLPRRWAVLPFSIIACFIAPAQRVVVLGLDFNFMRLMVLVGVGRLLIRRETATFQISQFDMFVFFWGSCRFLLHGLLCSSSNEWISSAGEAFDGLGLYFAFRCLVQDWEDVIATVKGLIVLGLPVALAFVWERQTSHNLFSLFGGVPEITVVRDGKLRCQGAFAHPIVAGCFWASLLPAIVSLRSIRHGSMFWVPAGLAAAFVIIFTCSSSTPMAAVGAGALGGLSYHVRNHMQLLRRTCLVMLLALHLVMKAPVWHLISRIDLVGGSTGYHRFLLIDNAIRRVDEWWMLGTLSTAHWGYGLTDVCNQYVYEAVEGGLASLILFVAVLVIAFRAAGRLCRWYGHSVGKLQMAWALGVAIFIHLANFLGLSYFGQMLMIWGLQLATLASLEARTCHARQTCRVITAPTTWAKAGAMRKVLIAK